MNKAELRESYLAKRKLLTAERLRNLSVRIAEQFLESVELSRVTVLHTFIPIPRFAEVDTLYLCSLLRQRFPEIQIVVPRLDDSHTGMESIPFTSETCLKENRWGIPEPVSGEAVDAEAIDVVLVPGLCFDLNGHRVGYGKGFYDRFLADTRPACIKVGLCFFSPVDYIEDVHDGDIRVNALALPDEFIQYSPS